MEDKKLIAFALLVLFGGNLTGIVNTLNPDFRADPFSGTEGRDLQRQLDEIKQHDAETRQLLQELLTDYHDHIEWGRDVSISKQAIDSTQDAQIQELYRRLP